MAANKPRKTFLGQAIGHGLQAYARVTQPQQTVPQPQGPNPPPLTPPKPPLATVPTAGGTPPPEMQRRALP